jgi:glycosyltransferase involved in cell wall biosynthesis
MTLPGAAPALREAKSERDASDGFMPTRVIEIELTEPLPKLAPDGHYGRVWILAKLYTEPIGVCVVTLPEEAITPDALAVLLWTELREPVARRFEAAGRIAPAALAGSGLPADPDAWPFLRDRAALLAHAPFISVVVCTRDRPEQIKKCLSRLAGQQYPRYEVVVVDNAPTSDALRHVVEGMAGEVLAGARAEFRYHVEQRPGLSWARNAGIAAAASDIIAFLDDDDEPDEHWLAGVAGAFAKGERVGCVSGIVLPARLDNAVENLFEEIGGHSKGRGFVRETFTKSGPQSPLWPLPPFGVGANMAFRRAALDRIGGFDVALGAGTPTGGGEDTLAITLVMLCGYEVAYEPAALMWHHHRQDMASLNKQLHGYSVGLTAFYAGLLRQRPGALLGLVKLLPLAAGYLKGGKTAEEAPPEPPALAAELDRRQLQGMLMGPVVYAKSRRLQRRAAATLRH